jgi:hypothetical protein
MPIDVISNIQPINDNPFFGVADDEDMIGGLRSVADIAARDAIYDGRRKDGMRVWVRSTLTLYQLQGGITNGDWVEIFEQPPGGLDTQVQYNNAGVFGGMTGVTWDGTTLTVGSGQVLSALGAGTGSQKFGVGAAAAGDNSIALGNASASSVGSIAIGSTSSVNALAVGGIAVGRSAAVGATSIDGGIAIGDGSACSNIGGLAVGKDSIAGGLTTLDRCTALGNTSQAVSTLCTAVGYFSRALNTNATAVGGVALVTGANGSAFGCVEWCRGRCSRH